MQKALEPEAYRTLSANSPQAALELLSRHAVSIVISDQNMPDMSGIEFFRLIRERHPNVCRIMLTGDPERDTIIRAVNEGEVYRFLPKPWNNTMLRVTVYFAFEAIQLEEEHAQAFTRPDFGDRAQQTFHDVAVVGFPPGSHVVLFSRPCVLPPRK